MSIYERIQEVAKREKLTVRDIERHFGYANGSLRKWKNNANSARLLEVADFLGVSTDFLLGRTRIEIKPEKWILPETNMFNFDVKMAYELYRYVDIFAFNLLYEVSRLKKIQQHEYDLKGIKDYGRNAKKLEGWEKEEIVNLIMKVFSVYIWEDKEYRERMINFMKETYDKKHEQRIQELKNKMAKEKNRF